MARQGGSEDRDRWWQQAEGRSRRQDRERQEYDPEYERFRSAKYAQERGWEPGPEEGQRYGRGRQPEEEQWYGRERYYQEPPRNPQEQNEEQTSGRQRFFERAYDSRLAQRGFEIRRSPEQKRRQEYREESEPGREYGDAGRPNRYEWDVPGPYRGRGPRGYRRSDKRISEEVSERLMQDGRIDASDLEVEVMDGVVMLTGTVDNRQIKRLAEEVVERVPGVTDVQNRVRLRESEQEPHGRESRFGQRERDYR